MSSSRKTFYEVLGVKRNAKSDEIARAYARVRADMQKETSAPDARLAAMAKVAYATLSDPGARAEYDESLGIAPVLPRVTVGMVAGVVAIVAAAGAAYYFVARSASNAPSAPPFDVPRLLDDVGARVGRVQAALVSGEVRDLGLAVETGENEMLTTCRGIEPGTSLMIKEGKADLRAEVGRADSQSELCTLSVKGAREAVKLRTGTPSVQETLQAIILDKAAPEAKPVTVARLLNTPHGPAFTLKSTAPLPNGTPLFDSREQLAGVVISPHDQGEGTVLALAASRVESARAAAANEPSSSAAASGTQDSGETLSIERRPGESLVGEGFATLWKEEDNQRLAEVLDNVTTGKVGLPIAYWTRWRGVDGRRHSNQCVVTYGDEEDLVAAYEQYPSKKGDELYRYCSLTRFQVDLDDLPVGEYHFVILVDGKPVAENSIRLEKRLITPARLMILVLVVGLSLLAWVRKRRATA